MKTTTLSIAALALAASAVAEPKEFHLTSKRMFKRQDAANFNFTFLHINDIHAHLDQFSSSGTDCTSPEKGCYGGYARVKHTADDLRKKYPNNLWLDAGDEFQGTLYYSYYGPEKIAEVLNILKYDAMTLGNHEWDGGDEELGQFIKNLTFPVTSCNVESEYDGVKDVKKYVLFEKQGIAVIGATTETTPGISSVGDKTKFLDPIPEIVKAVKEIKEKTNINRIVVLSHLGYDVDQKLAAETEGISLIIGAHSHTLLGDMDKAEGKYPTITKNKNGDEVFIVTAYRWGEYFGHIDVLFDKDGKPLEYTGAPIHLTNKTEMDQELQAKVKEWRGPFEAFAAEVVGNTKEELDQTKCRTGDCLLGQVMADAMLEYRAKADKSDKPRFAFINSGGVRATISAGDVTRGGVLTSFPFGNSIVEIAYKGKDLLTIFEGAVSGKNQKTQKPITSWFQVSKELKVEYNPENNNGSKLITLEVDGKAVEADKDYLMVTLDFLAGGGDFFLEATKDIAVLDTQDEVLIGYLKGNNPLDVKLESRVAKTKETSAKSGDSATPTADAGAAATTTSGPSAGVSTKAPLFAAIVGVVMAMIFV